MRDRQLKIINLLMEHAQGISGVDLSRLIGVSARTIRSDIKSLAAELEKHGAKLHSTTRNGYRIEVDDEQRFQRFKEDLEAPCTSHLATADERLHFILKKMLYHALRNHPITQAQLADEMFISLSTLKVLLREAAKKLEKYRLRIVAYKNKGIQIDGDEAQIRYCIAEYIFDRRYPNAMGEDAFYQGLFPDIDFCKISDIILQVIARREIKLTDTALKNLLIHTAIAIQRAVSSHSMIYTAGQVKHIEKEPEFVVASDLAERIYRELQIDIAAGEVYYVAQHLIASKKYDKDLRQNAETQRGALIEKILCKVWQTKAIDFFNDENLMDGLAVHLSVAIPRMKFQMNIRNEALDLIKTEYPLAFQIGVIAGGVIEASENVRINENEIGYLAIHFGAALHRMGVGNSADVKKALIVCANGIGTAILLKTRMQKYFKDRIEVVQTIPGYLLTPEKVDGVDLVLTTVPIKHIKSEKMLYIRYLLNEDEVAAIEERVFGKVVARDVLPEFFREDCFYQGLQFKNKWEVIEFLTRQSIEKGLMDEDDKASVIEREEASSTEIGNLVAIPHPIFSGAEVSSISILILKKPILWDEQQVQVVFLLNIAKDKISHWEPVFLKLFDYLVKENGVKAMIQEPSYEKFMHRFLEKF